MAERNFPQVTKKLIEENNGILPDFSSIGGYRILYVNDRNKILCGSCATKQFFTEEENIFYDLYQEGPNLYCEECGVVIESDLGDPDDTDLE